MQTQRANALGQVLASGRQHAAFAGRHILARIEAERDGIALVRAAVLRPHAAVTVSRAYGVRGVFYDEKAVFGGKPPNCGHFAGQAGQMDRQNGASAGRNGGRDRLRVEVSVFIDISEHGLGADVQDAVDGGAEGQWRSDDFVSRSDAQAEQGQMQRSGAGTHGQGMASGCIGAEFLFETSDPLAAGEPPRAQRRYDLVDFFLADRRTADRDEFLHG